MRKGYCLFLSALLVVLLGARMPAQVRPGGKGIYHDGWTDFNKNGRKDPYEDPKADVARRVEDLLAQMTLEEKTCQTATLYGYARVLKDELPTPEWKRRVWKDGIANIDEHLNGWGMRGEGSQSVYATDIRKRVSASPPTSQTRASAASPSTSPRASRRSPGWGARGTKNSSARSAASRGARRARSATRTSTRPSWTWGATSAGGAWRRSTAKTRTSSRASASSR